MHRHKLGNGAYNIADRDFPADHAGQYFLGDGLAHGTLLRWKVENFFERFTCVYSRIAVGFLGALRARACQHLLGAGGRHDNNSVGIADDEITRMDRHTADRNRHTDPSRMIFLRSSRRDAASKDRKSKSNDFVDIAHAAVGHASSNPAHYRGLAGGPAPNRSTIIFTGIDDDYGAS